MSDNLFRTMEISASGLHAEWVRMQVVANNVANADTTETPEGGPYRKRHVVFSTVLDELSGVSVSGIVPSLSPPRMVFNPGHPDANGEGFVAMPNVKVPLEMIDMLTASRAYEANLAAMQKFRQICEEALKLLR
ncbi:MAG: flagellar basal body rod protein FlgC [Planctomycetota bacterium]|jgi:flagellar basal-body rod protein FlgC